MGTLVPTLAQVPAVKMPGRRISVLDLGESHFPPWTPREREKKAVPEGTAKFREETSCGTMASHRAAPDTSAMSGRDASSASL
jgi:hypothetical protein